MSLYNLLSILLVLSNNCFNLTFFGYENNWLNVDRTKWVSGLMDTFIFSFFLFFLENTRQIFFKELQNYFYVYLAVVSETNQPISWQNRLFPVKCRERKIEFLCVWWLLFLWWASELRRIQERVSGEATWSGSQLPTCLRTSGLFLEMVNYLI